MSYNVTYIKDGAIVIDPVPVCPSIRFAAFVVHFFRLPVKSRFRN